MQIQDRATTKAPNGLPNLVTMFCHLYGSTEHRPTSTYSRTNGILTGNSQMCTKYKQLSWVIYDTNFRLQAAGLSWASTEPQISSQCLTNMPKDPSDVWCKIASHWIMQQYFVPLYLDSKRSLERIRNCHQVPEWMRLLYARIITPRVAPILINLSSMWTWTAIKTFSLKV